jgi:hypothetical protein
MTATIASPIYYPSGDGQRASETFDHFYVIMITIAALIQYLYDECTRILNDQYVDLIAEQARANALEAHRRDLQRQIDRYRERFGDLPD